MFHRLQQPVPEHKKKTDQYRHTLEIKFDNKNWTKYMFSNAEYIKTEVKVLFLPIRSNSQSVTHKK